MSSTSVLLEKARIGQFVSVGVVGATIETVIVFALTGFLGVAAVPAKFFGAEASITTMFLVNDNWTFSGQGDAGAFNVARRWVKSHLVRIVGLSIAFSVLYLLTNQTDTTLLVGDVDLWPTVANLVGIAAGLFVNYVFESVFTWRVLSS